jgi:hypothetical protein
LYVFLVVHSLRIFRPKICINLLFLPCVMPHPPFPSFRFHQQHTTSSVAAHYAVFTALYFFPSRLDSPLLIARIPKRPPVWMTKPHAHTRSWAVTNIACPGPPLCLMSLLQAVYTAAIFELPRKASTPVTMATFERSCLFEGAPDT